LKKGVSTLAKISQKNLSKYINRIDYAEQKRDAYWRDKWLAWYKRYRNIRDQIIDPRTKKPRIDRSNISIPYGFTMVETVLPRLIETLFAARPYVSMKGMPPGTSGMDPQQLMDMLRAKDKPWETAAKKMETLIDYQMNVPMDIQDVFDDGLKILAIYGTTVSFTGWCYREKEIIRKERQTVMSGEFGQDGVEMPLLEEDGVTPVTDYVEVTESKKSYDDPEVAFLDLGLFYADPNGTNVDDARYCGHDVYKSKADLKEMEKEGLISVDWKRLPKDARTNEARNYRQTAIGLPTSDDQESNGHEDDLYQLTYYWEDDKRVLILNRKQIVAEGPNPYWHKSKPYDKEVYSKVPGEFYGIGIMEITEDLQDELNVERNQRIDYRSHSMRRMFKMRRGAEIDKNQLVWKQNGIIEVQKMDDVDVLAAPDGALAGSFNQEQIIKQDIRDTVGAHDIVMGTGNSGTATESMAKDNNASIRFKKVISSIEKKLLVRITRKMVQMNQQYIDDVRMLPLFDQDESEWPVITPEEIQGEFHLSPSGSSVEPMANKEAYKQRMVELYGMFRQDPFYQQFPGKRRNLMKIVYESFDITETDDLLPSDDELAGVIKMQAVQEWLATLPPQAQQIIAAVLTQSQGGAPPQGGLPPGGQPPDAGAPPEAGGANAAMMQEQGMQMAGVGV
jgi:hypothetical protein